MVNRVNFSIDLVGLSARQLSCRYLIEMHTDSYFLIVCHWSSAFMLHIFSSQSSSSLPNSYRITDLTQFYLQYGGGGCSVSVALEFAPEEYLIPKLPNKTLQPLRQLPKYHLPKFYSKGNPTIQLQRLSAEYFLAIYHLQDLKNLPNNPGLEYLT